MNSQTHTFAAVDACRSIVSQAQSRPDQVAARTETKELTYGQLLADATVLAQQLRPYLSSAGQIVGVALENSPEALVAILAAWLADAAFLAVDSERSYRHAAVTVDGPQVQVAVTHPTRGTTHDLEVPTVTMADIGTADIGSAKPDLRDSGHSPDWPACVYYTSGSTGASRGAVLSHGALSAYVANLTRSWEVTPQDRFMQVAALTWATSGEIIMSALTSGSTLVILEMPGSFSMSELLPGASAPMPAAALQAGAFSVGVFLSQVVAQKATILDMNTIAWRRLIRYMKLNGKDLPSSVRLVVIGGDRVDPHTLRAWRELPSARGIQLLNTYGATEFGVALQADFSDLMPEFGSASIGEPLPGVRAYVDGREIIPARAGEVGELAIGGATLASGYLGESELTAERFGLDSPCGSGRRFRTGDLVRIGTDGSLGFVGRQNRQVQHKDAWINLSEIEDLLEASIEGTEAIAVQTTGKRGVAELVVLVSKPQSAEEADYRDAILHEAILRLPEAARPDRIMSLSSLPVLPSGKKDIQRAMQLASSATPEKSLDDVHE